MRELTSGNAPPQCAVRPVRRSGASTRLDSVLITCTLTVPRSPAGPQALAGGLGDDAGRRSAAVVPGFFALGEDALAWDDNVLSRGTTLVALRLLRRL